MAEKKTTDDKVKTKKTSAKKANGKKKGESSSSRKKFWLILCSVIGGLVVVGLLAWGIVSLVVANQPLEQDWAQTYYVYLDEHPLDPELKNAEDETIANADQYEVAFYDVEGVDEPVMAVNYVAGDVTYLTYYWVDGADDVKRAILYDPSEIKLLYNIEEKKNEYYIHYEKDDVDYYESLRGEILSLADTEDDKHVDKTPEYKFTKDDIDSVKDKDGKEYSITKFEQTFVEVEDDIEPTILPTDYDKANLKDAIRDEAYEYQVLDEIAKKHIDTLEQVLKDIEKKQNEINDIKKENAEIEAKKKAEEEARRAEEEAKKGLKLEGKTLAWGRYKLDEDWFGPNNDYIIINQDKTCTYDNKPCTWYIGKKDYAQSSESVGKYVHESICFKVDQYPRCLFAYKNNVIGDGDIQSYTWVGN